MPEYVSINGDSIPRIKWEAMEKEKAIKAEERRKKFYKVFEARKESHQHKVEKEVIKEAEKEIKQVKTIKKPKPKPTKKRKKRS